jgi:hypothetical protein
VAALLGRRFDELKLVVIYIDGMVFGDHVMIGAVGVDAEGHGWMPRAAWGGSRNWPSGWSENILLPPA